MDMEIRAITVNNRNLVFHILLDSRLISRILMVTPQKESFILFNVDETEPPSLETSFTNFLALSFA